MMSLFDSYLIHKCKQQLVYVDAFLVYADAFLVYADAFLVYADAFLVYGLFGP